MLSVDHWKDRTAVINHLGSQLTKGRLALFLGAGVSQFYGLPGWTKLVNRLCDQHKEPHCEVGKELTKIGAIKAKHYKSNPSDFLKDVKAALYDGVSIDFKKIRENDLLAAIGALLLASQRGSASQIITLNYDDLVELYLEYHGLVARAVSHEMHWQNRADVTVYHPHGLLSLDPDRGNSETIVFGSSDYHEIMRPESAWRSKLLTILRTHTTIYIGLSGEDPHLQVLLAEVHKTHAINQDRQAFHGVRFDVSATEEDIAVVLEGYGVSTTKLKAWDELAPFLFEICQAARKLRMDQL